MGLVSEGNKTFRILSCIGIVLIMLGHLNCNILEFGGLFPYYSYHVMIFAFISGYFYKVEDEDNIGKFLVRKMRRLVIPYYALNAVAGITTVLLRRGGYEFGVGGLDFKSLLFEPINGGHHYMLIAPGWFIITLFLLEVCNVVGRKLLSLLKLNNEFLIMALYLLAGIVCVALAKRGSIYDYYRIPARLMFMAPVFQLGRLYKTKLENDKKFTPWIMIVSAILINLLLRFMQIGLAFSAVWVSGFAGGVWLPYVSIVSGIALWLGVSILLSRVFANGKIRVIEKAVCYIGIHTFSICMLHLSAFLVVNIVLSKMNLPDFDYSRYMSDVYYAYDGFGNAFMLVYLVLGVLISLALSWCFDKMRSLICGSQKIGKTMK